MPNLRLSGIIPSPPVVYRDASCRQVDLEAYREHLRFLLRYPISALCIGGHAGETECLTMDERLRVLRVAVEESGGRIPVMGGVIADSTWSAIDQAQQLKEHGADVALVCPPNIVGWDAETADAMLVEHCRAIDSEVGLPFVVYGGPGDRSSCRIMPKTFTALATRCENLVGMKIAVRGIATGENSFADCVAALKTAQAQTGREVAPLIAGDANLLGALDAGAAGTINACESVRVDDNTKLYAAYQAGDKAVAQSLAERWRQAADVIYGLRIGRSFTYFHYRFKIATWMLGRIPNPAMRLPQVPPPQDEIAMLADALAATGKPLVHTAAEFVNMAVVAV
jgi:dihydrodipicolinate synthase/N-acetylneuraminate lyase